MTDAVKDEAFAESALNTIFQRNVQHESWENENLAPDERIALMAAAIRFQERKVKTYRRRAIEAETQLFDLRKSSTMVVQVRSPDGKYAFLPDAGAADDYIQVMSQRDNKKREDYQKEDVNIMTDQHGKISRYLQI